MGMHSKQKNRSLIAPIIIVVLILAAFLLICNIPKISDSLKSVPILGSVVDFLDFTSNSSDDTQTADAPSSSTSTVRLNFDADKSDTGAPVYLITPEVAPNRLEFTLYNVRSLDMQEIISAFSALDCVEDVYRTIVLDDSMRCFTVELSDDIVWQASEYADGYFDFTVTDSSYGSNDLLYIVRSESSSMDEDMASMSEDISDFSPSIVKTQQGEYCIIAGACTDEEEAEDLLDMLSDDFYIEECEVFSNPK